MYIRLALLNALNKCSSGCGGSFAQYGQFMNQCSCSVVEFETAPRDQSQWGLCIDFERQYAGNLLQGGEVMSSLWEFDLGPMRCAVSCQGKPSSL